MPNTISSEETDSILNDMKELLEANRETKRDSKFIHPTQSHSQPFRKKNKLVGIELVHSLRIQLRSLGGMDAPELPVFKTKKVVVKSKKDIIPSRAKETKIALVPAIEPAPVFELTPVQKIIRDADLNVDPVEEKIGSRPLFESLIIPPRRRERKPRRKRQVIIRKRVIPVVKKRNIVQKKSMIPYSIKQKKTIVKSVKKKSSRARIAMKKLSGKEKLIMALMKARSSRK